MKLQILFYSLILGTSLILGIIIIQSLLNNETDVSQITSNKKVGNLTKLKKENLQTDISKSLENNEVVDEVSNYSQPVIEVFRVEPDGNFVVAGSGHPESRIFIKEKDEILNSTFVDEKGKWVLVSQKDLNQGDHLLIVEQYHKDGTFILSKDIFVTKINKKNNSKPIVFTLPNEEGGKLGIIQKKSDTIVNENNNINDLFLSTGVTGSKNTGFKVIGIQFDKEGKLSIFGSALIGLRINAKINNDLIYFSYIKDDRYWEIITKDNIEFGHHSLKLTLLDKENNTLDIITLPFYRTEIPSNLLVDDYIIIEPGDMLWKIAYKIYGDGWKYLEIFDANREQISNPDLIFPGQIFILPKN